MKRMGGQTWQFDSRPRIVGSATVVGPEEGAGPLSTDFSYIYDNIEINEKTWEKGERRLFEHSAELALIHSNVSKEDVQCFVGGDLMNQIISSSFAARKLSIPFLGVFGACSTSMESLAIASLIVDSGAGDYAMAGTASHNCTVEKQFRYPTEYGSQKPPTAQYTVTGSGCAVVGKAEKGTIVDCATIGRVTDMGIKDPFNMGAAMAPAATDTILSHFRDTEREPSYYDLIVTGDLASIGHSITTELLKKQGYDMNQTEFNDCGLLIYDREKQKQVIAGASGAGCSAVVTYGHLLNRIKKGELQKVLVVATGALLSPLSYQQGDSIPCVAHAVALEAGG